MTRSPYNSFSHIRFCIRIRIRFRFHFGIHDDKRVICRPICRGTSFVSPFPPQGQTCRRGKYQKRWEGKGDKFGLAAGSRFLPVFVETSLKVIQVVGQQCGRHPPVSVSRLQFWLAVCCHLLHAHACSVCALSVAPVADGGQLVSQISR